MAFLQIKKYLEEIIAESSKNIIIIHDPSKKLEYLSFFNPNIEKTESQKFEIFNFCSQNIQDFFFQFELIRDSNEKKRLLIILSITDLELYKNKYLTHIFCRSDFYKFDFIDFIKKKFFFWTLGNYILKKNLFWYEMNYSKILRYIFNKFGDKSEFVDLNETQFLNLIKYIEKSNVMNFLDSNLKYISILDKIYELKRQPPDTFQKLNYNDIFHSLKEFFTIVKFDFKNLNGQKPRNSQEELKNHLKSKIKEINSTNLQDLITFPQKNVIFLFSQIKLFNLDLEFKRLLIASMISEKVLKNTFLDILFTNTRFLWYYKCIYENLYSDFSLIEEKTINDLEKFKNLISNSQFESKSQFRYGMKCAISLLKDLDLYPKSKHDKGILLINLEENITKIEKKNQIFNLKSLLPALKHQKKKKKWKFKSILKEKDFLVQIMDSKKWVFWMDTNIEEVGFWFDIVEKINLKFPNQKNKKRILDALWIEVLEKRFINANNSSSLKLNYKLFFTSLHLWDNFGNLTDTGKCLSKIYFANSITSEKFKDAFHYIILTYGNYFKMLKEIDEVQKKKNFFNKGYKKDLNKLIRSIREEYQTKKTDYKKELEIIIPVYEKRAPNCWLKQVTVHLLKIGYGKSLTQMNEEITRRFSVNFQKSLKTDFYVNSTFIKNKGYIINWDKINSLMQMGENLLKP